MLNKGTVYVKIITYMVPFCVYAGQAFAGAI